MSTKDRRVTKEVAQFSKFNRDGDVIPHGWNESIGNWHKVTAKDGSVRLKWRSRPFAERLLARIVWFYTPSPVTDDSGKLLGYKRKFDGPFWIMNRAEMADALGCSIRTITDETKLLRELGLIKTQPASARIGPKLPRNYVIPRFDAIAAITPAMCLKTEEVAYTPEIVKEETSPVVKEETSPAQGKKLPSSSVPSSVPLPLTSAGDQIAARVGESEPLPILPVAPDTETASGESANGQSQEDEHMDETEHKPAHINGNGSNGRSEHVDMLTDTFNRAVAAKANPAPAVILAWHLPAHLERQCLDFQDVFKVKVTRGDKIKWARGAKVNHDLHVTRELMEQAKADNPRLTITWPGGLQNLACVRKETEGVDGESALPDGYQDCDRVITPQGRQLLKRGDNVVGELVNGRVQAWMPSN